MPAVPVPLPIAIWVDATVCDLFTRYRPGPPLPVTDEVIVVPDATPAPEMVWPMAIPLPAVTFNVVTPLLIAVLATVCATLTVYVPTPPVPVPNPVMVVPAVTPEPVIVCPTTIPPPDVTVNVVPGKDICSDPTDWDVSTE